MNHRKIMEENIIEKYLMRELPPEERQLFEEHFLECDTCFEKVKETEKAILGIKDAAHRGILASPITRQIPRRGLAEWFESFSLSPVVAVAAIVLVLVLIYPAWQGIFTIPQLKEEIRNLRQPQSNVPVYSLLLIRSGEEIPMIELSSSGMETTFILSFNIFDKSIPSPSYRAEILNTEGKIVWIEENLRGKGEFEVVSIVCRSSFFKEGDYVLKVLEMNPQNQNILNEFSYPFRIVFASE